MLEKTNRSRAIKQIYTIPLDVVFLQRRGTRTKKATPVFTPFGGGHNSLWYAKKNTLPVSHYTPAKGSNFFDFFFLKFESANFEYFLLVGVKLSKKTLVKSEHVLQET